MFDLIQTWIRKLDRTPRDVVGIDFGSSNIKCVRLRRQNQTLILESAAFLPPFHMPADPDPAYIPPPLSLPRSLLAPYCALVVPSELAVLKILTFPGEFTSETENQIVSHMGLDKPDEYRINYKVLQYGTPRSESRVLAGAYPDRFAAVLPRLFPSGPPAPFSLEIAGLASLSALLSLPDGGFGAGVVGSLEIETHSSVFAVFHRGLLVLIRKFNFGIDSLLSAIRQGLDVSPQIAYNLLSTGSIDVSQWTAGMVQPFVKQLLVSRDFVERRENATLSRLFVCGAGARLAPIRKEIQQAFDMELREWNPLDGLTLSPHALSEEVQGEEGRLAAAVGAARAVLEGSS